MRCLCIFLFVLGFLLIFFFFSFTLYLFLIWHTHTLKSELLPKTIATRLACQCNSKFHMCVSHHNILIKYLCKLNFKFFLCYQDWTRTSFARFFTWWFLITFKAIGKLFMWVTSHKEGVLSTQLHHPILLNWEKQEPKVFATKKAILYQVAVWFFNFNLSAVRMGLEPMTSGVTGRHSKPAELTHQVLVSLLSREVSLFPSISSGDPRFLDAE